MPVPSKDEVIHRRASYWMCEARREALTPRARLAVILLLVMLALQIALGIARQKPGRQVVCLDGDGATLMQLGGLATIGWVKPKNFRHIVLNNCAHESVGGQPSAAATTDLAAAARSCGYASVLTVETKADLEEALRTLPAVPAPAFLEIKVSLGSRKDLGRPKETPQENKKGFMDYLNDTN